MKGSRLGRERPGRHSLLHKPSQWTSDFPAARLGLLSNAAGIKAVSQRPLLRNPLGEGKKDTSPIVLGGGALMWRYSGPTRA